MSTHAASASSGDAVSDGELGGDILFGLLFGTPLTYVVVLVVCLMAGIGLGNSLAVSILPCVLSGVFFDGKDLRQFARWSRNIPVEVAIGERPMPQWRGGPVGT